MKTLFCRYGVYSIWMGIALILTVATGHAGQIQIPNQSEWKDNGIVLMPGPPGSWDMRLSGMISPSTVVKKDGTYFLYYIGADGDRGFPHTDKGPRHRALGVAISTDGIHFTKYSGNPILTFLPNNNDEEGIFSAGATLDPSENIVLYYGAMDAGDQNSTSVDSDVRLAISSNGLAFRDLGDVLSHSDRSVWGYGDELFPIGAFHANGKWYVYYIAKGWGTYWDLGLAWGSGPDNLTNSKAALTGGYFDKMRRLFPWIGSRIGRSSSYIIGGGDPVWVGPEKFMLFIVRDFTKRIVDLRSVSSNSPNTISSSVAAYNFNDFKHSTTFLDTDTKTWFMYYLNRAGDAIHVKTASEYVRNP